MAKFNEILVGRYNRFVQKLLSMKGPASLSQLAGELQTVLPMFTGAENRYLETWDRFAYQKGLGALAANTNGYRLRNPAGSNVIVVVESIFLGNEGVAGNVFDIEAEVSNVDLATNDAALVRVLDTRGRGASTSVPSSAQPGVSIGVGGRLLFRALLLANTSMQLISNENQEIPLLPGSTLNFFSGTNAASDVSILWRERLLEESERA